MKTRAEGKWEPRVFQCGCWMSLQIHSQSEWHGWLCRPTDGSQATPPHIQLQVLALRREKMPPPVDKLQVHHGLKLFCISLVQLEGSVWSKVSLIPLSLWARPPRNARQSLHFPRPRISPAFLQSWEITQLSCALGHCRMQKPEQ